MDNNAFRARARECGQLASLVSHPRDKAFWLRLAADWLNIAAQAEKRSRAASEEVGASTSLKHT